MSTLTQLLSAALGVVLHLSAVQAIPLDRRQESPPQPTTESPPPAQNTPTPTPTPQPTPTTPAPSTSSSSGADSSSSYKASTRIIIPIVAVIAGGVFLVVLYHYRHNLKKIFSRSSTSNDTSLQPLTAEALAGGRSRSATGNATANAAAGGATGAVTGTGGAAAGTTTTASQNGAGAARANRRRSRGRGVRRTESGRSVRTLPEYTKEAGDEELVLVRRRSGSMSDESYIAEEDEEVDLGETPSASSPQDAANSTRNPGHGEDAGEGGDEGRDQSNEADSSTRPNSTGRGWGQAPTYLEAMSALNPDDPLPQPPRGDIPEPKRTSTSLASGTIRRTASGIRDLLSRPFGPSSFRGPSAYPGSSNSGVGNSGRPRAESQSSLLHPTTSRFSTVSSSQYNSPWASTASLLISPPVPNTARRASFNPKEMPKRGLTDQQMKFISSSEALNLVGVQLEETPNQRRRRRSEAAYLDVEGIASPGSSRSRSRAASFGPMDAEMVVEEGSDRPPPSWEEVNGERRRNEAAERRELARPITREEAGGSGQDRISGGDGEGHTDAEGVNQEEEPRNPETEAVASEGDQTTNTLNRNKPALAPALSIPAHLLPDVQVEPPTPVSSRHLS